MSREELYHTIEQYLDKQLDAKSIAAFEDRLSKEPELRQEVELHRKMQEELGDPIKRNLRSKLDQLRIEHTLEESDHKIVPLKPRVNWMKVVSIAAGVLLFGFLIWLLVIKEPVNNEIVEQPKEEEEQKVPPSKEIIKEEPNPIVQDETPEPKENEKPSIKDPIKTPVQDAMASLIPNPLFENLVSQNGIQKIFEFSLKDPKDWKIPVQADQSIAFHISGDLKTTNPEEETKVMVNVFNNKAIDSDIAQATTSFSLPVVKEVIDDNDEEELAFAEKSTYYFNLDKNLKLTPGLYYYTLILEDNPRVLYCNKFTVTKE